MELPKNITQIGESNNRCKIYVEDYVISYMKQLNRVAMDKDMAVALYGINKEENGTSYIFLYGAAKLTFLQKETRHLSQAQQQEIERLRRKYFAEYSFMGYRLLNGEMLEGFHICEQDICRYISGYAQFYEKNDGMLAYMLDEREEGPSEIVDEEKYEMVRRRQEERRAQHESGQIMRERCCESAREAEQSPERMKHTENRETSSARDKLHAAEEVPAISGMRGMRVAVVGVFALLCLVGLKALNNNGSVAGFQAAMSQAMNQVMEQKIPDADTLVAEEKLTDAVLQENEQAMQQSREMNETESGTEGMKPNELESENADLEETESAATETETAALGAVTEPEVAEPEIAEVLPEPETQPIAYKIQEGDTLIGISVRNYGTDAKVETICAMNQIKNADDIKVGQVILLP